MNTMKKMLHLIPVLLLLASAQSKPAPPADLALDKARAAQIERYVAAHPRAARYFADTNQDPYEGSPRWRELKAKKPGVSPIDNAGYTSGARVWTRGGSVALVEIIVDPPSGDWSRGARYFFREDGTLSRLDSTLATYQSEGASPLMVHRDRFFNRAGRLISESTGFSDGKTGKKLKGASYRKREAPVYARLSSLPFYALLRKSGLGTPG